jgi:putative hydrolase of the HAD superfamily
MGFRAYLVDVYETVVSCDFAAHAAELPALAGVDRESWNAAFRDLGPAVTDGRMSMFDAYAEVVRRSGATVREEHVRVLVQRDNQLLRENCCLYEDTVPFLEMLRCKGVMTALVSNCFENTRPLLADLGLIGLVDAVVLSCEVGAAKPDPSIYEHALRELRVPAHATVFVDDQDAYCDGASALGIHSVRICRSSAKVRRDGRPTVASLADLDPLPWSAVADRTS